MAGRDIIGIAKTGSGKTVAFLLPMLRHVLDQGRIKINEGPIALLMTPTRELAMQAYSECRRFTTQHTPPIRVVCAYGGAPIKEQIADLRRGAEVLICTPGRLIELLLANSGRVTNLRRVTYVVLDEADRMFDMGFGPQVVKIVGNIRPDRQTVLLSATFPASMEMLARRILHRPLEIVAGKRGAVGTDVKQIISFVKSDSGPRNAKFERLLEILGDWFPLKSPLILVFVDRQESADTLLKDLARKGYHCNSLHGGKDQADRDCAIADFKSGIIPILVATSVAARGLDVRNLHLVINFDCPSHQEDYVHRVGRTGRAGNTGTAITIIDENSPDDERYAPEIVKALSASGVPVPKELNKMSESLHKKVKEGTAHTVGSGFGGRGLARIDEERQRTKKTQKLLLGADIDEDSDEDIDLGNVEESKALPAASGGAARKDSLPRHMSNPRAQQVMAAIQEINERLGFLHGEKNDPLAELISKCNTLNASIGSRNPDIHVIYERGVPGDSIPGGTPRGYYAEVEINDYPQAARYRITHKDYLASVMETTGSTIAVKGEWIPAGRAPQKADLRKLYIRIDGLTEMAVERALKELRRIFVEAIADVGQRGLLDASRYGIHH